MSGVVVYIDDISFETPTPTIYVPLQYTIPSTHSVSKSITYYVISIIKGFDYRKKISIRNDTGVEYTNIQIPFTVNRSTGNNSEYTIYVEDKCLENYNDIRFSYTYNNEAFFYYIESPSSSSATIWVKIPSLPTGYTDIYIHYGNSDAESLSNGYLTFDLFDDFDGIDIDTSIWNITKTKGTITVEDSFVTFYGPLGYNGGIQSIDSYGSNTIFEGMYIGTDQPYSYFSFGYGVTSSSTCIVFLDNHYVNYNLVATSKKDYSSSQTTIGAQLTTPELFKLERRGDNSQVYTYADYSIIYHTKSISSSFPINISIPQDMRTDGVYSFDWVRVRKYFDTTLLEFQYGQEEHPGIIVISNSLSIYTLPMYGNNVTEIGDVITTISETGDIPTTHLYTDIGHRIIIQFIDLAESGIRKAIRIKQLLHCRISKVK